jgi:hypothetical protein
MDTFKIFCKVSNLNQVDQHHVLYDMHGPLSSPLCPISFGNGVSRPCLTHGMCLLNLYIPLIFFLANRRTLPWTPLASLLAHPTGPNLSLYCSLTFSLDREDELGVGINHLPSYSTFATGFPSQPLIEYSLDTGLVLFLLPSPDRALLDSTSSNSWRA